MNNFVITKTVKAENSLFEPICDEALQLSETQQLVVTDPILPGKHIAEQALIIH